MPSKDEEQMEWERLWEATQQLFLRGNSTSQILDEVRRAIQHVFDVVDKARQ